MTRFVTVNRDPAYRLPPSGDDRLPRGTLCSPPVGGGLGRAAVACTALMLVVANSLMLPAAHAYKVERVCEQVTTKRGTSEVCTTKLVPGSEQSTPNPAPAKPDPKDKKQIKGTAPQKP